MAENGHDTLSDPWPMPETYEPGREYAWAPATEQDALLDQGWEFTSQRHKRAGLVFSLYVKGTPLPHIHPLQLAPSMLVLVPDDAPQTKTRKAVEKSNESDDVMRVG